MNSTRKVKALKYLAFIYQTYHAITYRCHFSHAIYIKSVKYMSQTLVVLVKFLPNDLHRTSCTPSLYSAYIVRYV